MFARLSPPVDFGAKDGPADLAFLIAAPEGGDQTHRPLLTQLARALVRSEFTDALRAAGSADEVVALVGALFEDPPCRPPRPPRHPPPERGARWSRSPPAPPASRTPTWLRNPSKSAAERAGCQYAVETQGSAGARPLAPEVIAAADAVIFAVDVGVRDRGRFAGKPVVSSGVKRPIDEGDAMIAEALRYADDPGAPRVEGSAETHTADAGAGEQRGRPDPTRPDDRRVLHDPVGGPRAAC